MSDTSDRIAKQILLKRLEAIEERLDRLEASNRSLNQRTLSQMQVGPSKPNYPYYEAVTDEAFKAALEKKFGKPEGDKKND